MTDITREQKLAALNYAIQDLARSAADPLAAPAVHETRNRLRAIIADIERLEALVEAAPSILSTLKDAREAFAGRLEGASDSFARRVFQGRVERIDAAIAALAPVSAP